MQGRDSTVVGQGFVDPRDHCGKFHRVGAGGVPVVIHLDDPVPAILGLDPERHVVRCEYETAILPHPLGLAPLQLGYAVFLGDVGLQVIALRAVLSELQFFGDDQFAVEDRHVELRGQLVDVVLGD
jgi:hypothetical protein